MWECFGWFCGGQVAGGIVVFQDPILQLRCMQIAQHPCTCSLHQVLQVVRHGNSDAGACPPCFPSLHMGLHVCRRSKVPHPRSVNLQVQITCFALLCFCSSPAHCSYLVPTLVYLLLLFPRCPLLANAALSWLPCPSHSSCNPKPSCVVERPW